MAFDRTYRWPFEQVEVVLLKIDFVEQVLDFDSADLGSDWPKVIHHHLFSKSKTIPDVAFASDFDSFDLDSRQTF